jgi:hypothetical protein
VLQPRTIGVATKTPAVTVVVGAQISINNQLKVVAVMARETMTTTTTTMTMKTKGSVAAAGSATAAWWQR